MSSLITAGARTRSKRSKKSRPTCSTSSKKRVSKRRSSFPRSTSTDTYPLRGVSLSGGIGSAPMATFTGAGEERSGGNGE